MDEIKLWYEEMPEIFEKEKQILESRGFSLNKNNNTIEFVGNSLVLKEYPLRIIYPDGYPSFPPTVISDVQDDLVLIRHQTKLNKVLCCFGFSSERWRADFTAREVLQEAEELITHFSPLTYDQDFVLNSDIVPEPRVNQYNYNYGGLLIPTPFGDFSFKDLDDINEGTIRYPNNKTKRGIVSSIKVSGSILVADKGYEHWFDGSTIYKTYIFKVDSPPPLITTNISVWLKEKRIPYNPKKNQFMIFVFKDEWGHKGNMRMAWVALKITQGQAQWLRCYLVSSDDINIRTPYGSKLSDKCVMVVGVGSLGSIVSTTLAQEGIGKFHLFDFDIYEPANTIRHQVRQNLFALPKVDGVADRILEMMPKADISIYRMAIGSSKDQKEYQKFIGILKNSDVVIDTTGEHSVSHLLNRLCVHYKVPLVVGSVTNGAWSCEIVKYIPNYSGCWGCWNQNFGHMYPPSSPKGQIQFAPGCDQPTFTGGISSINIAGGLVSQAIIDILLNIEFDDKQYIVWSERDIEGNRLYSIDYKTNPVLKDCVLCNEDK
ncbi:ThiF family adenylyltransferase [Fictibacillus enclensis]|uniref:HesA/MoeB/ThiF family protein n=1 Tax=Fictibacillus enclensis TaxID=1017270 RepID=UPI0025A0175E|nr:ThiF family adenylyltransferase [Fictibacillus enclensis]MDM5196644.1 ThiF family adenylyltransferase [Fictibacillus enclensis]